jgi:hypothetical protein
MELRASAHSAGRLRASAHSSFTASNGSPQLLHRCKALHAVPLNRAVCVLLVEPQRGHRAGGAGVRVIGIGPVRAGAGRGGAMPAAASFCRPSGVIQSLVHLGASLVRISTSR